MSTFGCTKTGLVPSPRLEDDLKYMKSFNTLIPLEVMQRTSPMRFKNRISPDRESIHRVNLSPAILEKNKAWLGSTERAPSGRMRRTASLDAIFNLGPSKDVEPRISLLLNKATQTPEEWDSCCLADITADCSGCQVESCHSSQGNGHATPKNSNGRKPYSVPSSPWSTAGAPPPVSDNIEKFIRHRLQKNNKEGVSSSGSRHSPVQGDHSVLIKPYAFIQSNFSPGDVVSMRSASVPQIARPLLPRFRSSVEELNQEIERLVLRPISLQGSEDEDEWGFVQDGRRAPIADYFRSRRSVNTQTPARHSSAASGCGSNHSTPTSLSPTLSPPPVYVTTPPESPFAGSGPSRKQTSPHINKFITKEPPDGCERVALKHSEEQDSARAACWAASSKPAAVFTLLPSLGSAFCPPGRTEPSLDLRDPESGPVNCLVPESASLVNHGCDDSTHGFPLAVGKQ